MCNKVKYEYRISKDLFSVATTSFHMTKYGSEKNLDFHHCITGIVFCAFSIEAMINHYGRIYFDDWNEKKGDRKNLHKMVFNKANLNDYLGTKNYQIAEKCFKSRDDIVHGKTTDEEGGVDLNNEEKKLEDVLSTKPDYISEINIENLEKYINTARNIESDIEENGYYPDKVNPETGEKEKLMELPLSNSGVYVWQP